MELMTTASPLVINWNLLRNYQGYRCLRVTGSSKSGKANSTNRVHIKVFAITRLRIHHSQNNLLNQSPLLRKTRLNRQLARVWVQVVWSASTAAVNINRYIRPYVTSLPSRSKTDTSVRLERK